MIVRFTSLALTAALTSAATAQTSTTAKPSTTHHTTAASSTTTPPNIPKVVGIPRTLYALKYIDIKIGTGALAEPRKWYTVHYTGWFPDGTKFDSSYDHPGGEPLTFPYGAHKVIVAWDTGFQGMHIGGKRRLFVPYQLAYGEVGRPPQMPAKANLIFDVELVNTSDTPPEPKTLPAAARPPQSAPPNPSAAPSTAPANPTAPATQPATPNPATQPSTSPHPQTF